MGKKQSKPETTTSTKKSGDLSLDDITLGETLGEGTFASVRYGKTKSDMGVAVKFLFNIEAIEDFKNEVNCMTLCNHENSTKLLGSGLGQMHEKREVNYLILELATHGELFQIVAMTGAFDEDIARLYAKQLYTVVGFFHSQGITHRDLKPENILLGPDCSLKVADFGLATELSDDKMTDLVGSPGYIAPEVYAGSYHHENDVWAAAVIHFILMTGCPPFRTAEDGDWWYNKLKAKKWDRWWRAHKKNSGVDVGDDAKDLFQQIFETDPTKRLDIKTILDHQWFKGETCAQDELMERFTARMGSDYNDYGEEVYAEGGDDVNRDIAGVVTTTDDDDKPPGLPGLVLPRRVGDEKENVTQGEVKDGVNRGGDDEKEGEAASVYPDTVTDHTKFKSKSSPTELFLVLKDICADREVSYSEVEDETYKMQCTVKGEFTVVWSLQVYQESADSSDSLIVMRRSEGTIRNYMSYFAKFREGLGSLVASSEV